MMLLAKEDKNRVRILQDTGAETLQELRGVSGLTGFYTELSQVLLDHH